MEMIRAKQMHTIYHDLVDKLNNEDGIMFMDKQFKQRYIDVIKEAYKEFIKLKQKENEQGKHGIRYTTCHDDSCHPDKHVIWFTTAKERDEVYEDFQNNLYWDEMFNDHLPYNQATFNNFNPGKKITRVGDKIYVEE